MVNRSAAVIGIATLTAIAHSGSVPLRAAPAPPPVLQILSPAENSYVSGATRLRAAIDPDGGLVSLTFFADGRQLCTVTRPPLQCDWDAGPLVVEHQIRVVAVLARGTRLVKTARTRAVSYVEGVDVEIVQVTAAVTDGGRFVHGLTADAFHVTEDGVPQKITSFSDASVPLDLVVAVDISGSMESAMAKLKEAVKKFLTAVPAKDTVTLLGFNDNVFSLARRATSTTERSAAVDRLAPWGMTALYDVILHAVDLVGRQGGRKAIVIFTDGEDQGSHVTLDMVERRLQETDATLFVIGQGRGTTLDNLKKIMQRLAVPTGGRAVFTDKIDQLEEVFQDLLNELSNQYLLGYASTNGKHDGTWRALKVRVEGDHHVRARQGYRAKGGG